MKLTRIYAQKSSEIKRNLVALLTVFLFIANGSFSYGIQQPADTSELPLEKLYLHLDKSFYTAGESIWFKAYLMDGRTYTPTALSEVVYVELIGPNGTILSKNVLKTNNGSAAGDFELSDVPLSGTYSIRAYTNYMRNFGEDNDYTKHIFVNTGESDPLVNNTSENIETALDIQFFPEGGHAINGFLNPIAFKVLDSDGNSISVSGTIKDDMGNQITNFSTSHLGMGLFHFIPKPNRSYSAHLTHHGEKLHFDLPDIKQRGVLMTVSNLQDYYKIELRATSDIKLKDYALVGKQEGTVQFNLAVNANKQENTTIVKLAKDIVDEGTLELTLWNDQKQPIAERLLFHENANSTKEVTIASAKNSYERRELVVLEIDMNSKDLDPLNTDMSLSVSNTVVNADENYAVDIKTYMLLNSVVKGKIEQPGYYFNSDMPERKEHLDLLMRTQGWRQYVVEDKLMESADYFLPEKGISLSGKVVSATNSSEPLTGSVSLTANNQEEMIQDRAKTDAEGTFRFRDLNFTDSTTVLLSANVYHPKRKRNPTSKYNIILDTLRSPIVHPMNGNAFINTIPPKAFNSINEINRPFLYDDDTIALEEVLIEAEKVEKKDTYVQKRKKVLYREPSQTVDFENFSELGFTNLLDALAGRVPGLTVRGMTTGQRFVYLRAASSLSDANPESGPGAGSALVLLDGTPVGGDILQQMLPSNVDFIDVLKGPRAAIYGSRAANGVVAIFSKDGTEKATMRGQLGGSLNFQYPGYDYSRRFYEPKYDANQSKPVANDNRTTLLWKPYIKLDENGKALVSFYVGDTLGDYQVVLEGMSSEGTPITTKANFEVLVEL
jgi:TonB-dependent SusC/RagA subfamily outer membrane receptor